MKKYCGTCKHISDFYKILQLGKALICCCSESGEWEHPVRKTTIACKCWKPNKEKEQRSSIMNKNDKLAIVNIVLYFIKDYNGVKKTTLGEDVDYTVNRILKNLEKNALKGWLKRDMIKVFKELRWK